MVFSSPVFLFLFFPAVLLIYYNPIFRSRGFRNCFLFLASILFYAWGEPVYVTIMLVSILVNWLLVTGTFSPERKVPSWKSRNSNLFQFNHTIYF